MKLKKLNYLTNLLFDNYTLLHIVNNISFNSIFIVVNISNMTNNDLLKLKNQLFRNSIKSMVIKSEYIKILFSDYFAFFKSFCLFIFIKEDTQFLNIVNLLKNSLFFYSYDKSFSNIINADSIISDYNTYNTYINFHYIIFKLINNILLILLFYIILFNKLLKF